MNKIRIAGAIASKTGITLYLADGKELNLPNSSWRTKMILEQITKPLARKQIVEIDLDSYSFEARIEEKSGGVIRFLRKTASAVAALFNFNDEPDSSVVRQNIMMGTKPSPTVDPEAETELVAVVAGTEIPVGDLEAHIDHAAFTGNTKGLERFLERIAPVMKSRGHTVKELLNFMKRADLPIADDGCIVGYKVLKTDCRVEGGFLDCHSGKVTQRVGSRVSMDEGLIDPSRRTQCSTGLHIARRAYLRSFAGDIITLVKIAPEDVIAVPYGEPDKMRARAYHIVANLPARVHGTLRSNKPMTDDDEAAAILADVIAGNHIGVIEDVVIGSSYGGNVTIKPTGETAKAPKPFVSGKAAALDANKGDAVKEIRKEVNEAVLEAAKTGNMAAAVSKPEKVAKPKVEKSKPEPKADTAAPAPAADDKFANIPEKYREAVKLFVNGERSQRQLEKDYNISAKTIRKLVKDLK